MYVRCRIKKLAANVAESVLILRMDNSLRVAVAAIRLQVQPPIYDVTFLRVCHLPASSVQRLQCSESAIDAICDLSSSHHLAMLSDLDVRFNHLANNWYLVATTSRLA